MNKKIYIIIAIVAVHHGNAETNPSTPDLCKEFKSINDQSPIKKGCSAKQIEELVKNLQITNQALQALVAKKDDQIAVLQFEKDNDIRANNLENQIQSLLWYQNIKMSFVGTIGFSTGLAMYHVWAKLAAWWVSKNGPSA